MPPATVNQTPVPGTEARTLLANAESEGRGAKGEAVVAGLLGTRFVLAETVFAGACFDEGGFFVFVFDFLGDFFDDAAPAFLGLFRATFFSARWVEPLVGFLGVVEREATFFFLLFLMAMVAVSASSLADPSLRHKCAT